MAQAKKVVVTGAQHAAARTILKRDAARGRSSSSAIKKIASAKTSPNGRAASSLKKSANP
jgi:hypothetical protein